MGHGWIAFSHIRSLVTAEELILEEFSITIVEKAKATAVKLILKQPVKTMQL
jgi:hypothetical protein